MHFACQLGILPGESLKAKLENLKGYGFDGLEVSGGNLAEIKDELKALSSELEVPVFTICSGYRGCLLDADPAQRNAAVEGIVSLMQIGDELGGANLICVPVFGGPRIPDLRPYKSAVELELELLDAVLREIARRVEGLSSCLLLEPLNRYETHLLNRLEQAVAVCKRVDSDNVRIMADFFHMHIEEPDIDASIREHIEFIKHFHLADSQRREPGTGHTRFPQYIETIRELGFTGSLAFECGLTGPAEEALPRSLAYLRDI